MVAEVLPQRHRGRGVTQSCLGAWLRGLVDEGGTTEGAEGERIGGFRGLVEGRRSAAEW